MMEEIRLTISQAMLVDLDALAPMFDAYRVFYRKSSDLVTSRAFLRDRIINHESVIYLANHSESRVSLGFVQLYPSFSSVSAERVWILNDLFVEEHARRHGVAHALLEVARQHALDAHAAYLTLATGQENLAAQILYESLGYVRETDMFNYALALG